MNESAAAAPLLVLAIYSGMIIVASLAGGWIPLAARLTHTRLQVAISFVAGFMLGIGVLHLLPHAWHQLHSIDRTVTWLLAGFLVMFLAQRFFHFHHHDVPDETDASEPSQFHDDHHDHHHHSAPSEHHGHSLAEQSARRLSWTGAAIGMTFHSLIDGIALAASVQADAGATGVWALGLGAFLVILLHKPFDAMAISTLMAAGGKSRYTCHLVNGVFALAIPLGAALFYVGAGQFSGEHFLGAALAFTAGTFLCISTSDLLPEIQFHTHDRWKLTFALLFGLGLAALIGKFEATGHDHHRPTGEEQGHAQASPEQSDPTDLRNSADRGDDCPEILQAAASPPPATVPVPNEKATLARGWFQVH
jgi:zinc and cadmium transporter